MTDDLSVFDADLNRNEEDEQADDGVVSGRPARRVKGGDFPDNRKLSELMQVSEERGMKAAVGKGTVPP